MSEIRPIEVFGVGNALVDLQVEVDGGFLESLGVEKGRMTLVEAPRSNREDMAPFDTTARPPSRPGPRLSCLSRSPKSTSPITI